MKGIACGACGRHIPDYEPVYYEMISIERGDSGVYYTGKSFRCHICKTEGNGLHRRPLRRRNGRLLEVK